MITSTSLICGKLEVTTYNIEAGATIVLASNNPRPGDSPIVTRSVNSKLYNVLAFTISSIKQVVLLAILASHADRIFANNSYANVFWMHFINEFVEDRDVNFFNSNFEFEFDFTINCPYVGNRDVLHITAANKYDTVYKSFKQYIDDDLVIESLLYMFVGLDGSQSIEHLFNSVSNTDIGLFNSLHIPYAHWIVDDDSLKDSNVNVTSVDDFIVMRMIKHYFGKFMPILVNSITLMED